MQKGGVNGVLCLGSAQITVGPHGKRYSQIQVVVSLA